MTKALKNSELRVSLHYQVRIFFGQPRILPTVKGEEYSTALAATHEAAALVLDSPYSSYSSAVEVAAAHYAIFPVNWLMFDRFRSDLAIGDVHIPMLVLHGDEDDVIPISLARRLFELANEPKTFMLVSGGKHLVLGLAAVFPRVRAWIDETTGLARRYGDA